MANTRDIKTRIKSISNTSKITSTMEMVSTAKMKKLQMRLLQSKPYNQKIGEILANVVGAGISLEDNPLFRQTEKPKRVLILQITGNRGLCGSFNTNVIDNTLSFREKKKAEGADVQLYVVGKKAINFYRFIGERVFKKINNPDDRLTFEDAARITDELRDLFLSGEFDEIYTSYTSVVTSVSQRPHISRLLPITPDGGLDKEKAKGTGTVDYLFEPGPEKIFSYILPLYLKMSVFTCFLESAFSENFARRVAMKNATDSSKDMLRDLKLTYNRVRQAKITTEIAEIVGGAAALE